MPVPAPQGCGDRAVPRFGWWCRGAVLGPVPPHLQHHCSLEEGKLRNAGSSATDFSRWKCDSWGLPWGDITYGGAAVGCFWVCNGRGA